MAGKLLLTGATGHLGSHILHQLLTNFAHLLTQHNLSIVATTSSLSAAPRINQF